MAAGAVSGQTDPGGIAAIRGRVLHDVGDGAEDVFDEIRHGVARGVAIALRRPPVVDAGSHESSAPGQFPGETAHDVFVVCIPSTTVDDDDDGKVPSAFWRIDVVLQGL